MAGSRTRDYNQRQRAAIESLRTKIATMPNPADLRVVDTKLTKHTFPEFEAGRLNRFEIRNLEQIKIYEFHVINR